MNKKLICKSCDLEFLPYIYVDGIRIPRYNSKYCLSCSPGKGNFNNRNTSEEKRQCLICKNFYELQCFSKTNKDGNLNSYCKRCATNKTQKSRQKFKIQCINYKGGQCIKCGYNKCPASFDFHHRDKSQKDFQVSKSQTTILNDKIKLELDKCDLLCANCHREEHYLNSPAE